MPAAIIVTILGRHLASHSTCYLIQNGSDKGKPQTSAEHVQWEEEAGRAEKPCGALPPSPTSSSSSLLRGDSVMPSWLLGDSIEMVVGVGVGMGLGIITEASAVPPNFRSTLISTTAQASPLALHSQWEHWLSMVSGDSSDLKHGFRLQWDHGTRQGSQKQPGPWTSTRPSGRAGVASWGSTVHRHHMVFGGNMGN